MAHNLCKGRKVLRSVAPCDSRRGFGGLHLPEAPMAANCCFRIRTSNALFFKSVHGPYFPGVNILIPIAAFLSLRSTISKPHNAIGCQGQSEECSVPLERCNPCPARQIIPKRQNTFSPRKSSVFPCMTVKIGNRENSYTA